MLLKTKDNLLSLTVHIDATNITYTWCAFMDSIFNLDSVFNIMNRKYAVYKLDQLPGHRLQTRSV